MAVTTKYTTHGAAGVEVDARAKRYVSEHQGSTYREATAVVLRADKELAEAYAQPASRRARMATTDARSQPAVPITPGDEAEVQDWVLRAITDGKAGSLPGALGSLAIEADRFAKVGMPIEEATRRAMGSFPHLLALAKILLTDIRRNAPEKPVAQQAQANPAGFEVHVRAEKLQQADPSLDYRSAVKQVLDEDRQLKVKYAGMK